MENITKRSASVEGAFSKIKSLSDGKAMNNDNQNAAVAAIQFALETDDGDGLIFLRFWNQGDFDKIRSNWPDAPEDVYIGADPLHPETII